MAAILVVLTIIVAVAVDAIVLALRRHRAPVANAAVALVPMLEPRPPQGIFLDRGHAWLRITTDGTLRVGIDDFLAEAVGDVQLVIAPAHGTHIRRGDPLFRIKVGGRELPVLSPASGEVVAVNDQAVREPWQLTRDPYGVGWVVSLWTRDHHAAIEGLRIGAAAAAFLRQELQRLADFMTPTGSPATVPLLADGGVPGRGAVTRLDEEHWNDFRASFLAGERER